MDKVAEPAPFLAWTTSSPPNWILWVKASRCSLVKVDLCLESGGSQDIQGGDTEQLVLVVDALLLEHFLDNWDGGVDWVGDNTDSGVWSVIGNSSGQVSDNTSVDVEQIVSGHTWLSWDTGWDQNNISTSQGLL
ncbi:hypothetical protein WICPIJ_010075 [Wickerhamomyces pijperi]|uniref:Uncharacterized protein n=1 Tax=Wickerhamomyces pijperi TaxID=599730 RepID=A0A9P8PH38_WICPI|nr:hypothetical protein WICPIJ_010075 [Wickerhamomyces pijperi]